MSAFKFLEAEDWNAILGRIETLEVGGVPLEELQLGDYPSGSYYRIYENSGNWEHVVDTGSIKIQSTGTGNVSLFEDQTNATQRYLSIYGHSSSSDSLYMYHDTSYAHINSTTFLKLQSTGAAGISLFEDQVTASQRYLYVFRPNTSEYLQLGHNGYGNIYSSTGIVNIANDDLIIGNPAASNFRIRESSNTWYVGPDAGDVQLNSGNGNIHLNSFGTGDVDLFLNQTTATQRYLKVHAANSANYIQMWHGGSYGYISSSAGTIRMNTKLEPLYGVSRTGATLKLQIIGEDSVSCFEDQTTATQRVLRVYAPNSNDLIQLYHDDVNGYVNTSVGGLVMLANTAVSIVTGSHEWIYFSAGGSFRWQDVDAGNAMRMTLDSATGALNVTGSAKIASLGLGNVTLFEDETDATQRYLGIFAPNVADYLQLYQSTTNAFFRNTVGRFYLQPENGIVEIAGYTGDGPGQLIIRPVGTGVESRITMYNDNTYSDSGTFLMKVIGTNVTFDTAVTGGGTEPTDIHFDLNLNLSSTRTLGFTLGTTINEFSTDTGLVGDSDDAVPTEKAVKAYVDAAGVGIPSGVIVLWSGSEASIPDGWVLCDGTAGTPDLTDKFVMGAGTTYAVDDEGGVASHQHNNTGAHQHNMSIGIDGTDFNVGGGYGTTNYIDGHAAHTRDRYDTGHAHDWFRTQSVGNHTHNSLSNLSPYYALAYIMKT